MMATWFSWLVVSAEYVFEETLYRRSLASFLLWQWNYKTRNSFIIHLYKRMLIKGNLELHIFVNVIIFFFYIMSCATWLKLLVEISMSLKHSFNGNVYLVEKKERKFYKHVYANKLRASITTVITFWYNFFWQSITFVIRLLHLFHLFCCWFIDLMRKLKTVTKTEEKKLCRTYDKHVSVDLHNLKWSHQTRSWSL